jgi:hypothetical protein
MLGFKWLWLAALSAPLFLSGCHSGSQEEKKATDSDYEYFCPMHPQIVRDNPKENCPICNMELAKRKKGTGDKEAAEIHTALAELGKEDQLLAEVQGYCPISGKLLGSMGKPVKVMLDKQAVFLCCKGCEEKARKDPKKTLAKVEERKAKPEADKDKNEELAVKANLAKLSRADRALAEAQKSCPISGELLGSMGKPFKELIQGQPVLLCCDGCRDDALKLPKKTLEKVKELKAKVRAEKAKRD